MVARAPVGFGQTAGHDLQIIYRWFFHYVVLMFGGEAEHRVAFFFAAINNASELREWAVNAM